MNLPPKKFTGLVGRFQRYRYMVRVLQSRSETANRLLLIEARERKNFDGRCIPFSCSHPRCYFRITQAGEWAQHTFAMGHGRASTEAIQPPLSPELEARLKERRNEFCRAKEELELDYLQLKGLCGVAGSEERREFEDEFTSQLENDPLFSHNVPARECLTWKRANRCLFNKSWGDIKIN